LFLGVSFTQKNKKYFMLRRFIMKATMKKMLSLVCIMAMTLTMLVGCAKGGDKDTTATTQATTEKAAETSAAATEGETKANPYEIEGKVTIAYPEAETAEIVPVLDAFRAMYPNIEVIDEPFPGSTGGAFNEYLTQRAAANQMPDVMWLDWNDFAPQVASGFVMPLDEFMASDPEAEYVPAGMTDPYTFGGKLYALPCQMNAMGITLNLDMLEEMNIDKPSYDWTMDEFTELLKKAISSETVGAATLEDLDQVYSAQEDGYFYPAYDYVNQKFDFTNKWVPSMNRLAELRAIPGLDAWAMKYPKAEDGTTSMDSDYVSKFGEAGKDDNHYTFKNGMALLCTNATWNDNWMRQETQIEWDYWPYPRLDANTPVKTPIHVDAAYLTSTAKNPEASFELLKWLTYGVEGNLQRLDIFAARGDADVVEGDTKLLKTWFIPCTQHPDVIAKFEENPHLTDGFKALYKSTANSIRGDINKILPGYNVIFDDEVNQLLRDVREGRANAADVAPQIDAKVNAALTEQLKIFNEKVGK
jgi:ABC-type glycerol-3-phosphate transport system substrate-binding protein